MDYLEILEKKKNLTENASEQERQKAMEYGIRMAVEERNDPPRIHEMMKKSFVACSEKERWITLSYEVEEWEQNPHWHYAWWTDCHGNRFNLWDPGSLSERNAADSDGIHDDQLSCNSSGGGTASGDGTGC